MAEAPKPLRPGEGAPKKLLPWLNQHLAYSIATAPVGPSVSENPGGAGTLIRGGSGGDEEVVTGAVNGVPATLVVLTDGSGWTPIVVP